MTSGGPTYIATSALLQTSFDLSAGRSLFDMDSALYISRMLSYSVILLSFGMKLPQILAILSSKHSKGVNARGYWMEIGRYLLMILMCVLIHPCISINSYLIGASYGYFNDFHISTYGEAILLAIQSRYEIIGITFIGSYYTTQN